MLRLKLKHVGKSPPPPPPRHFVNHDDIIKWEHFPRNWPFVRGIHRSPVNSPHKGQWRRALMFSLICVWINDCVYLRRHLEHYDVIIRTTEDDPVSARSSDQIRGPNPEVHFITNFRWHRPCRKRSPDCWACAQMVANGNTKRGLFRADQLEVQGRVCREFKYFYIQEGWCGQGNFAYFGCRERVH